MGERSKKNILKYLFIFLCVSILSGCTAAGDGVEKPRTDPSDTETAWIRNGEPIEFEGALWYPQDAYDVLLDSEMIRVGNYRDVNFYIEKIDVRPYNHLYTKFDRNKFRIFSKESND